MKPLQIINIAAVVSYFIPMFIVAFRRLWRDPFFMLFASYWAFGGLINLLDLIPGISPGFTYVMGVLYNLLDIPFILGILYCTTRSQVIRKFIVPFIIIILVAEIMSLILLGIEYESLKYPLGVGIGIVLMIVLLEMIRYMQKIEHSNRQTSKMFIYAAVLFEYATFIVIYIFDYFVTSTNRNDSFIIYYISTLVATMIASCGYLLFRKYEKTSSEY